MGLTYTANTRTECVGYNEEIGSCVILTNGKHNTPIDCTLCSFYKSVPDKDKYWANVEHDIYIYGTPLTDRAKG